MFTSNERRTSSGQRRKHEHRPLLRPLSVDPWDVRGGDVEDCSHGLVVAAHALVKGVNLDATDVVLEARVAVVQDAVRVGWRALGVEAVYLAA